MTNVSRTPPGDKHPARTAGEHAALYASAGCRVLQTNSNKAPAHKGWKDSATWEPTRAAALFTNGSYRIGLAMGRWRGNHGTQLVCIDQDRKPGAPDGVAALDELAAANGGDIGSPWVQHTPTGGRHYVYQVPFTHGNGTGGLPAGIDVRGDGGQIVAQSTDTDKRQWEPGHAPWDHEPGIMPKWLQTLLLDEKHAIRNAESAANGAGGIQGADTFELPPRQPTSPRDATAPGELYNTNTDWHTLLSSYGWRCVGQHADVSDWERPGQTEHGKAGARLRLNDGNHGVFYVWTSNAPAQLLVPPFLSHGTSHKAAFSGPFAVFAAMEHGGDFTAAARALSETQRKRDADRLSNLTGTPGGDTGSASSSNTAGSDAPTDDGPQPGHSLRFTTLADYTGDLTPRQPTVLQVERIGCLLYGNADNSIWGPSGIMKSWLAVFAALQEIRRGNHVLVIDYEMTLADWIRRLRCLGATQEQLRYVHYVSPSEQLRAKARLVAGSELIEHMTTAQRVLVQELQQLAARYTITLAVIDGVTAFMSSNGLNTSDADAVDLAWAALHNPIVRITGAAVLSVDHVTHQERRENKAASWPLGTQHKVSKISGTGLALRAQTKLSAYSKGAGVGQLDIYCQKDRHGQVGQDRSIATLWLRPQPGDTVHATLLPFDESSAPQSDWQRDTDTVLAAVVKLNEARRKTPSMGSISARKVALDTGLDQEKTKDLLEYLAQREQVQNMGTERNGDWVPRAPDYPVGF